MTLLAVVLRKAKRQKYGHKMPTMFCNIDILSSDVHWRQSGEYWGAPHQLFWRLGCKQQANDYTGGANFHDRLHFPFLLLQNLQSECLSVSEIQESGK